MRTGKKVLDDEALDTLAAAASSDAAEIEEEIVDKK